MTKEKYLQMVSEQIRCKKAIPPVVKEIEHHIEDQTLSYLSAGRDCRSAEQEAVADMGDPVETGIELDRIHRPQMAWRMIAIIVILSIFGLVVQQLISQASEYPYSIMDQVIVTITGLALMMGICYLDYSRISKHAVILMTIILLGLFVGGQLFGVMINGKMMAIYLMGFSIMISPMLLLTIPLYAATIYHFRGEGHRAIIKSFLLIVPPILLAISIPSQSTALILITSNFITLFIAVFKGWFRVPRKRTLIQLVSGMIGFPVLFMLMILLAGSEYHVARLRALVDTSSSESYQINILRDLLGGSQIIGQTTANSSFDKTLSLPDFSSTFVLTWIFAYLGIIVGAITIAALIILFIRFFHLSLKQKNQLGMLMGTSCASVLLLQGLLHIAYNLTILPATDGTLPFFSHGKTYTLVMYVLLGLILSIYRYQNVLGETSCEKKVYSSTS